MVTVNLTYLNHRIQKMEITGHADSGPHGEDIVCAGISVACIGALNALDTLCGNDCHLMMGENRIAIEAVKESDAVQSHLEFLKIQLQTVAEQYPQHIKITGKEV